MKLFIVESNNSLQLMVEINYYCQYFLAISAFLV